jgi:hypothetical protein
VGLVGAVQEREVEDSSDAEVVVPDSLEVAAAVEEAAEVVGCGVEATRSREAGRSWRSEEPCADCNGCRAQEREWAEGQERRCIAGAQFGIVVEACSSGSREAAESSLSEGDGCCSGKKEERMPRPCYGCMRLEVFPRWTMLSGSMIA